MTDIAEMTGGDFDEIMVDGLKYKLGELRFREGWGRLLAFLKQHGPAPVKVALTQLAEADAAGIPVKQADREFLLARAEKKAEEGWPPRIASPEFFMALSRTEGGDVQMLWEVLRVHQPSITVEQATEINVKIPAAEAPKVMAAALGIKPWDVTGKSEGGPKKAPAPNGQGGTIGGESSLSSTNSAIPTTTSAA